MRINIFPVVLLFIISCKEKSNAPIRAELWGKGKVSTEAPEFAITFNTDQTKAYFNRTSKDRSSMKIMYSENQDDVWSEAKTLPFSTGEYRDVDPFLTLDNKRLYFSSNRPLGNNNDKRVFNTWYVDKVKGKWSDPVNPGAPFNSDSTDIFVTISKSKNAYFVSERDGERGIVVSKFKNGEYQTVEKVVLKLNGKPIYASNPCISSDEKFLIVAARDPEGNGAPDLFVSWNQKGQWSELINLGSKVNSSYADFAPALSKDDKILFFTSERPGIVPEQEEGIRPPGDIHYVDLKSVLTTLE
ncbi:PD40 domain-containing protein [Aquimarina sp. MMG016]|uniref:PD40 domain-containing protein n=1 Tax=Aquimarina sp. MMG016 TaxID=2822690 RepID=UPI001B3A344E|nr:PD40 domain-containing protein [Aquimarina sp. MMG016]MBQ4821366.1 PD40 domain-containing protein [Aquimarina sp. MMG016]